jgi:glycosyltransferase involved in cell wall biosynthesis
LDITVFISCYNEKDSIVPTMESVSGALAQLPLASEILVIDDNSTDESVAVVEALMRTHPALPIRLERHDINRGLGYTIFEAARHAQGKHFWCVAGDNPVSKETCVALLSRIHPT